MSALTAEAIGYIEKAPFALLVTVGEGNKPFARYVGPIVNIGLAVYFVTRGSSQKVKHMDKNPFVTLHIQLPEQPLKDFKGLSLAGKAVRVPEGSEYNEVLDLLGKKSPGFKNYVCGDTAKSWVLYKVTADTLHYTDLAKSTKTVIETVGGEARGE
jgi:uncharacterized pyridoxamine 5'-phosphate oxidase family protein